MADELTVQGEVVVWFLLHGTGGVKIRRMSYCYVFFFFQAEDGIRDVAVTGVQTCALPISLGERRSGASTATRSSCAREKRSPLRRVTKASPSRCKRSRPWRASTNTGVDPSESVRSSPLSTQGAATRFALASYARSTQSPPAPCQP